MPRIELGGGKIYDIPRGNNVTRGPRKTKHIPKVTLVFQPTLISFYDNATVLLPKSQPPEDGHEKTREGVFTFGCHLDNRRELYSIEYIEYDKNIRLW